MSRKTEPARDGLADGLFAWGRQFVLSWALLVSAFCCFHCPGATNDDALMFEATPPKIGSVQWGENQRTNRERQEQYRRRVPIPDAVLENVPRLDALNAPGRRADAAPQAHSPVAAPGNVFGALWLSAAILLAGFLTLQKLAPQSLRGLNQRFNPWASEPAPWAAFTEKVRAEEESFDGFVANYRGGLPKTASPGASGPTGLAGEFYAGAATLLNSRWALLENIMRENDPVARQKMLSNLRATMAGLKEKAGFPEVLPVWQVASALEGLLKQLAENMRDVTPSALRTVVGGLGLLDDLCAAAVEPHILAGQPLKFLVVDDDWLSRHALSVALNKAFSQPDLAVDGAAALALAQGQAYDVIFLDVQMPGMDGFELCTKIRQAGTNRATPVVFVTGMDDFDARVNSTLSGGNDLMGKPFLTFEITVKALTLGLQGRLHGYAKDVKPSRETPSARLAGPDATRTAVNPASATPLPPSTPALPEMDGFDRIFLDRVSQHMGLLLEFCQKITLAPDATARQALLADGFLCVNSLVSHAGSETSHPAYQVGAALEGLFRKLLESAKYSSASTLATVTAAVELLDDLCAPGVRADLASNPPIELLVVDDDLVARRVIVGALQTAFNRPESVENGEAALALAAGKTFDVVFLDVVMPGMDGFEVCSKIRTTRANQATPVVFVTSKNDLATRAEIGRSGGNDLLGKPFLTAEITVKALTFALRGRLQQPSPGATG